MEISLRGCGKVGAEPGDARHATQLLAESALIGAATGPTGTSVYCPTCTTTSEDDSESAEGPAHDQVRASTRART